MSATFLGMPIIFERLKQIREEIVELTRERKEFTTSHELENHLERIRELEEEYSRLSKFLEMAT